MIVKDPVWKSLFFTNRLVYVVAGVILLFILASWWPVLFAVVQILFYLLLIYCVVECVMLYRATGIEASRKLPHRFSNGDDNPVWIRIRNHYPRSCHMTVYDEWPDVLQARGLCWKTTATPGEELEIEATLRPTRRGRYAFGHVIVMASIWWRLFERRYRFDEKDEMAVYPSFLHLHTYELKFLGTVRRAGVIQQRSRLGHGMTFEQIKTYVPGDPQRWINWKSTAKRQQLMVNQYSEEWSKDMWCIIDKGRLMKMPFDGLSLLDHAINASMAVAHIATKHDDHIGVFTFSDKLTAPLMPGKGEAHLKQIAENLHRQRTKYMDSRYDRMVAYLSTIIPRKSLLLLFTNFETEHAYRLRKQAIIELSRRHHLAVLFFKNDVAEDMKLHRPRSMQELYESALAHQHTGIKDDIVKDLRASGVIALQVSPSQLGLAAIDQYLQLRESARTA